MKQSCWGKKVVPDTKCGCFFVEWSYFESMLWIPWILWLVLLFPPSLTFSDGASQALSKRNHTKKSKRSSVSSLTSQMTESVCLLLHITSIWSIICCQEPIDECILWCPDLFRIVQRSSHVSAIFSAIHKLTERYVSLLHLVSRPYVSPVVILSHFISNLHQFPPIPTTDSWYIKIR